MIKFVSIIAVFSILLGGNLVAQCTHATHSIPADEHNGWRKNSQSKIKELYAGDKYEIKFVTQAGVKYRIQAFAGLDDLTKRNISFQLIVKEVNRIEEKGEVSYKSVDVILYDSELSGSDDEAIIQTSKTQNLSIKVKIHGAEVPSNTALCAVVLIEEHKSKSVGLR